MTQYQISASYVNPPISQVSFGRRHVTKAYKVAEQLLQESLNKGYKSSTYFSEIMLPKTVPDKENAFRLFVLKDAEYNSTVCLYRILFDKYLKFTSEKAFIKEQRKIIDACKILNCNEYGLIAFDELTKRGIPCRLVADKSIDHTFVIVNRKEPFTSYKDAKKGEFILDLWLKRVYHSVEEAYLDFKNRFGAKAHEPLLDKTERFKNRVGYVKLGLVQSLRNWYYNIRTVRFFSNYLKERALIWRSFAEELRAGEKEKMLEKAGKEEYVEYIDRLKEQLLSKSIGKKTHKAKKK